MVSFLSENLDNGGLIDMATKKTPSSSGATDQVIAEALRNRERREKTYRERALKIFPWICGRCGREFEGKRVRELTVHHKDHNHDNNPPDGSNWELLCIYCHDNEHSRDGVADSIDTSESRGEHEKSSTFQPFAGLADLLKKKQ
jgi:predicted HNH restriction endonuclease